MELNKHHVIIATATAGLACIVAYYKYAPLKNVENKINSNSKVNEVLQGDSILTNGNNFFTYVKSFISENNLF